MDLGIYRQTPKAKAMMSAKLILDVHNAAILNNSLLRAATDAASIYVNWAATSNAGEAVSSGTICLQRLQHIERVARAVESERISKKALLKLHQVVHDLKLVMRQRRLELFGESEEEEDLLSKSDLSTKLRLPMDIKSSAMNASLRQFLLCLILLAVSAGCSAGIILGLQKDHATEIDDINHRATIKLALVVKESLNVLYDAMVANNANVKLLGPTTAAGMLFDMSSRTGAAQDVQKQSDNYLVEYRGAVQDFDNSNQVTSVLTQRAYGGICQTNLTYSIVRVNDIEHNASFVIPQITPNSCGNDATTTGIFSFVVPSYLRYSAFAATYRHNLARLAAFYHSGFGLSVAITRDRETLQQYITPDATMVGKSSSLLSQEAKVNRRITIWCGLVIAVGNLLILGAVTWMMASEMSNWRLSFSILVGLLVSAVLAAVLLATQRILIADIHGEKLLGMTSIVEGIVGAVLSKNLVEYDASSTFLHTLATTYFSGALFTADSQGLEINPPEMSDIATKIDMPFIASYHRGQYLDMDNGYAISATYLSISDLNIVLVNKLSYAFKAHWTMAIVFIGGVVSGLITYSFARWSSLSSLRFHAVGSPVLRYHFHGSQLRMIFYAIFVLANLISVFCVATFGRSLVQGELTPLASASMTLLGALIRTDKLLFQCYDNCGMPDFVVPLFFAQTTLKGDEYPTIKFIDYDFPYPYPSLDDWEKYYVGSQLSLMNMHTSLVDVPSFSTPIVNYTNNISTPQQVVRHMLSSTGINTTTAFSTERFPDSYFPRMFNYNSYTIGVFLIAVLLVIGVTICEWKYIEIHEKFRKQEKSVLPFVVMGCMVVMVFCGFIGYAFLVKVRMNIEFSEFNRRELCMLVTATSWRMELLLLKPTTLSREEVIERITTITTDASTLAMILGTRTGRVRLATEYPDRGGGLVIVHGLADDTPVNIGPLDRGYVPVCGTFDGIHVSKYLKSKMNYCYVEMSQPHGTDIDAPRFFLLAATERDSWTVTPVENIWGTFFGVTSIAGLIAALVSGLALFYTLHAARATGFPLLKESEIHSFLEPLPTKFSVEYFLPRRHRMVWVCSLALLGIILAFASISTGQFMHWIDESYSIKVPYTTQGQELMRVVYNAVDLAYSFLIFPIALKTTDQLLSLGRQASSGDLRYTFVTDEGIKYFNEAMEGIYYNLTLTDGILNKMLQISAQGYGTYTTLLADYYQYTYIANQVSVLNKMESLRKSLLAEVKLGTMTRYGNVMDTFKAISELNDLLRKLYILDHMVLQSYADPSQYPPQNSLWPFSDAVLPIVQAAREANTELQAKVADAFIALEAALKEVDPTSTFGFTQYLQGAEDLFSSSVGLFSYDNMLWQYQALRCEEIKVSENKTVTVVAQEQQAQELAGIEEQMVIAYKAVNLEMNKRKTTQFTAYVKEHRPLEGEQVKRGWQRVDLLHQVDYMWKVCVCCTLVSFIVVGACIILNFRLLRRKTELSQREVQEQIVQQQITQQRQQHRRSTQQHDEVRKGYQSPDSECMSPMLDKNGKVLFSAFSSPFQSPMMSPVTKRSGSVSFGVAEPVGHAEKVEAVAPYYGEVESTPPTTQTASRKKSVSLSSRRRKTRWVTLPVAALALITLVPLVCSFWMVKLAWKDVESQMHSISGALVLYEKVMAVKISLEAILRETVSYYVGVNSELDFNFFLSTLEDNYEQLLGAYYWHFHLVYSAMIPPFVDAYAVLKAIIASEVQYFKSKKEPSDVLPYYNSMSEYARTILPNVKGDNTFGVLMPIALSTEGSAVYTYANDAYTAYMAKAQAATTEKEFIEVCDAYVAVLALLEHVSEAELQMWHAAVTGSRTNGYKNAQIYTTFSSLVGPLALASMDSSTIASAAAAKTEITNYFQTLESSTSTDEDIIKIFTDTTIAPALSSPPVSSDAYFEAGYAATVMSQQTTIGKWANIFAYNRGMVDSSSSVGGDITLVEAIDNTTTALLNVLSAIGSPAVASVTLAEVNPWIWHSQVYFADDEYDLGFLQSAVQWCSITSFWALMIIVHRVSILSENYIQSLFFPLVLLFTVKDFRQIIGDSGSSSCHHQIVALRENIVHLSCFDWRNNQPPRFLMQANIPTVSSNNPPIIYPPVGLEPHQHIPFPLYFISFLLSLAFFKYLPPSTPCLSTCSFLGVPLARPTDIQSDLPTILSY
eukprot:gene765-408_t